MTKKKAPTPESERSVPVFVHPKLAVHELVKEAEKERNWERLPYFHEFMEHLKKSLQDQQRESEQTFRELNDARITVVVMLPALHETLDELKKQFANTSLARSFSPQELIDKYIIPMQEELINAMGVSTKKGRKIRIMEESFHKNIDELEVFVEEILLKEPIKRASVSSLPIPKSEMKHELHGRTADPITEPKEKNERPEQQNAESHFAGKIKQILAESGVNLSDLEAEKVSGKIRNALNGVLHVTEEQEQSPLTEQAEEEIIQTAIAAEPKTTEEEKEKWPDFLPPLPEPGGDYPRYSGYTDAYQFLKKSNWSQYLKHFNPKLDKDYLTQSELKKRDLALKNALWAQRVRIEKEYGVKTPEIVPATKTWKRKARVPGKIRKKMYQEEVERMTTDELKRMESLVRAKRRLLKEDHLKANAKP